MTIGLVTITHNRIGSELLTTATQICGRTPVAHHHLEVHGECDPDAMRATLMAVLADIDSGQGVLILTDLFGATPCNIARNASTGHDVRVVTGINLPMVLRVFNYAHLELAAIADKAAGGGQQGILRGAGPESGQEAQS